MGDRLREVRCAHRTTAGRWSSPAELPVPVRYVTSRELGVVDFHSAPAPGVEAVAHARILANGDGTEVVLTQFQGDAPDEVFDAQVEAVTRELVVLQALAETECPP